MDFLLGVFTGYFLTWPAFILMLVLGTIFESNDEHGLAVFAGMVSAVTAYFFFKVDLQTITVYIGLYFAIGFGWSIWRYKRAAAKVVEKNKDATESERKSALRDLHPKQMLGAMTSWVFIWPFSMVENVTGDVIKLVQTTITAFLKGIYHRIYMQAVGQLLPESKE
jgi:hypothetical protein